MVGGMPTRRSGVSMGDLRTGSRFFPHWISLLLPRCLSDKTGLLQRLETPPFVCWFSPIHMAVRQTKPVGSAPFGIPGSPALCNFCKSQRDHLAHRRCDRVAVDPVLNEVIKCHRKLPVLISTVMCKLHFQPRQDAMSGLT